MPYSKATTHIHPTPRRRVLLQGASIASAAMLVLAACTPSVGAQDAEQSASAADTAHGAAWQQKNFSSFYTQKIDWRACTEQDGLDEGVSEALKVTDNDSSNYQCGTVKAPMNWADPTDTRTIDLAVIRIPSTAKDGTGTPLFNNPGGPGASGVVHTMTLPASPGFDKVREKYELWGFDPRGIGNSTPLNCEEPEGQPSTVTLANCVAKNEHAQYMGTSHVARDMEMLRVLSGAEQLNYHGYSYGTVLGATYATLFPDKAGRIVLDSADDARWASLTNDFDQQVAVSKAVGKMADNCSTMKTFEGEKVTCPFTSEREMLDYINTLNETPLKTSDGYEFTGADMKDYLTTALYMDPGALLDLLGKAKAGDQESTDVVSQVVREGGASVSPAGTIALCPSAPSKANVPALIEHMKEVGVPEFLGGPSINEDLITKSAQLYLDCAAVPSTGTDINTSFDASKVKTPILVVGITGDHATPYQHGQELTKQLGNATLLTVEGEGHGASFAGRSECADEKVADYLLEGKVPEKGATCQLDPVEEE